MNRYMWVTPLLHDMVYLLFAYRLNFIGNEEDVMSAHIYRYMDME
jgi:hypothetical protein